MTGSMTMIFPVNAWLRESGVETVTAAPRSAAQKRSGAEKVTRISSMLASSVIAWPGRRNVPTLTRRAPMMPSNGAMIRVFANRAFASREIRVGDLDAAAASSRSCGAPAP